MSVCITLKALWILATEKGRNSDFVSLAIRV